MGPALASSLCFLFLFPALSWSNRLLRSSPHTGIGHSPRIPDARTVAVAHMPIRTRYSVFISCSPLSLPCVRVSGRTNEAGGMPTPESCGSSRHRLFPGTLAYVMPRLVYLALFTVITICMSCIFAAFSSSSLRFNIFTLCVGPCAHGSGQ